MAAGADADSAAVSKSGERDVRQVRQARFASPEEALRPSQIHAHGFEIRPRARKPTKSRSPMRAAAPRPRCPAWVANANAQMTAADAPPDSAKGMSAAMSEKANTVLQAAADKPADAEAPAEPGAVAPDQLNDVDRALHLPNSRCHDHADGCAGLDRQTGGGGAGQAATTTVPPGQDLADRKDLHRLRRPADDGVGRAHVHGVADRASGAARRVRSARAHLKPTPAAGTLPAKSVARGGSWRRSNTSLSRARARSASSR